MDGLDLPTDLFTIVTAYLVGSIPVGLLVARFSGGVDPRTVGSGRTGGTNALRALGRERALLVVVGDILKGALPVILAGVAGGPTLMVLAGVAAIAGSIWSIFVGFRSGRGVATLTGTMLALQPLAVLLAAPIFVVTIALSRYVSLGSLLGAATLLPATLLLGLADPGSVPLAHIVHAVVGPALVWIAHADNIDRLIHGTERRFDFALLGRRPNPGA